jgi:hypothetical protein
MLQLTTIESRPNGFGDTIEKITTATGIKYVVKKASEILDADCGCNERKEALNNPDLLVNKIFYKNGV